MNLKTTTYCLAFISMLLCIDTYAYTPMDTVRLKPIEPPKKKLPAIQPIVIKTSPTAFLWGGIFPFTAEYRLMLEMTSSKKQSEQISISILGKSVLLKMIENAANQPSNDVFKVSGWRIQYAHKFYLINRRHAAPFGFYVAPLVSYTNARIALGLNRYYHQSYYDFRHFNANLIFGLQVGKTNRVTLDIYGGAGYKTNKVFYHFNSYNVVPLDTKDFGSLYNNHFNAVFGINIGYSL
jgi:hypothetical protein